MGGRLEIDIELLCKRMKTQKLAGHSGLQLKSNILEAETKELRVQGQAGLHSEFQASLG